MNRNTVVISLGMLVLMSQGSAYAGNDLDIKTTAALGYSSNVYHAPSAPYFDFAAVTPATVTPNVQSGAFVPLGLDASYALTDTIDVKYGFDSQFYLGSSLSNANVYDHTIELLTKRDLDGSKVDAGAFLGWHSQVYFDKDTGENKLAPTSLTDISVRYNYQAFGVKGKYKIKLSGVEYALDGKYVVLNYDTVLVSELDNTQLHLGASAKLKVADGMKVKLGYKYSSQDYDKRKARDANAALVATLRSYTYHNISSQLSWKIDDSLKTFWDAGYTKRVDNFVGYNDYTKTALKVRVLYDLNDDISLRSKLLISNTDYANAFIFEDPTLAKKTSDSLLASLTAKYKTTLLGASSLWAKLDYKNISANDLRYNYSLTEMTIGGDWKF